MKGADEVAQIISSAFYAQVLSICAEKPDRMRFWSVARLVLEQVWQHLDPRCEGLAVLLTQCLPPSNGKKVRSLYGALAVGIAPWGGNLEQQNQLLGAESFAGYVLSSDRAAVRQNLDEYQYQLPSTEYISQWPVVEINRGGNSESNQQLPDKLLRRVACEIAAPIKRGGLIAGCLHVCSNIPDALLASQLPLIQSYADILTLAFNREDFYPPQDLSLMLMPPWWVQAPYIFDFRHRVNRLIQEATSQGKALNVSRAELIAWQQLEEEYLHL